MQHRTECLYLDGKKGKNNQIYSEHALMVAGITRIAPTTQIQKKDHYYQAYDALKKGAILYADGDGKRQIVKHESLDSEADKQKVKEMRDGIANACWACGTIVRSFVCVCYKPFCSNSCLRSHLWVCNVMVSEIRKEIDEGTPMKVPWVSVE